MPKIRAASRSARACSTAPGSRIPARVPVGTYTAETFLIRDGRVIAGAVREIRIEKLGFERFVADAAERWSFAYGIVAVAAVAAARLGGERALPAPLRLSAASTCLITCLPYALGRRLR